MKISRQIPWNAILICETFKISYKESLPWIVPQIRFVRGWNLEEWHIGCRHWGVGKDRRIRNLLKKTQCERGDISQTRRIYFSNRRWTDRTSWRRSGTWNIHLDTGTSNSRRKARRFSWRLRRVSSNTSSLISRCWWSDKWLLLHVKKLHIPPSRWTESQTLFDERRIIPYSIDVSRTTHTNLDVKQERRIDDYWNIDGSRDLSGSWTGFTQFTLLDEEHPDGFLWFGWEIDKTAVNIQARSFTARALGEIWKKCQAEGEA